MYQSINRTFITKSQKIMPCSGSSIVFDHQKNVQLSSHVLLLHVLSSGKLIEAEKAIPVSKNDILLVRGSTVLCFSDSLSKVWADAYFFSDEECRRHFAPEFYDYPLLNDFFAIPEDGKDYLLFHCQKESDVLTACSVLKKTESFTDPHREKLNYLQMTLLLVHLHRIHQEKLSIKDSSMMKRYLAGDILKFLSENCQDMTLRRTAAHFKYNPAYFSALCKNLFDCTFSEKLKQLRFEQAEYLLLKTNLPIHEISASAGYRDQNYFHKVFKERYGTTPLQYRKRHTKTPELQME